MLQVEYLPNYYLSACDISKQGIDFIKRYEGYKEKVYICPGGYKTIGYGHVLKEKETMEKITMLNAHNLLIKDLKVATAAVRRYIDFPLTQHQFDALTSFTFNLGAASLQRSTLRQKINYGELEEAAEEFERWVYSGGQKLPGLVVRRLHEERLFRLGEYV